MIKRMIVMQPHFPPPIFLAPIKARIARINFSMSTVIVFYIKVQRKCFESLLSGNILSSCYSKIERTYLY